MTLRDPPVDVGFAQATKTVVVCGRLNIGEGIIVGVLLADRYVIRSRFTSTSGLQNV
jgi:hypothetical protein